MALVPAKSDIAHYLHATLERFDTVAIQDISRLFSAAAANVAAVEHELVELSYDESAHVFTLKHHNCFGGQLDEALGRIIRNYVASESDAVTRFAECALGDPLDDEEFDSESEAQDEDWQDLRTHVVNFDGINTLGKAKAFQLRDLPPVLRNRALRRHNIENLATTISLRRVRLDPKTEQHVFGGSLGAQLPDLSSAEQDDMHWLLQLLEFAQFVRKISIPGAHDPKPEVEHLKFAGKEPAIGQWLEGMGETGQIDPDVQPEMGGEQFKFAHSRTLQNDSLARVRKPKGVPLADFQLSEGQPLEQPDEKPSRGFAALMRPDAISDAYSDSDEENHFEAMKQVKVVERVKSDNASTSGGVLTPSSTSQGQEQSALTIATRKTNAPSSISHQSRSQFLAATPSSQGAPRSDGGFLTDGRSYAKADRWGLTGDAANHVAWEKENAVALLAHRAKRAPRTYDELASTRAESATSASGRDSHMDSLPPVAAVTPMSYNETPLGGNEPWAKNIVRPDIFVPTGTLVNTDIVDTSRPKAPQYPPGLANTYASVADTSRSKPPHYPPGFYPPLGSNEQQRPKLVNATNTARAHLGNPRLRHPAASQTSMPKTSTKTAAQRDVDLMSFNDVDDSTKTTTQGDDNLMSFNDDDNAPFIEHGKAPDEEPPRLHRTMGQQAKNKHQKKKSAKSNSSRSTTHDPAVLELPSPPPPPRPKPSPVAKPDANAKKPIEPDLSIHIEQVISNLFWSTSLDGEISGVEVQFGLALMTDAEDLIAEYGVRAADMQEKLDDLPPQNRNTVFQPVLGRQREDGVYLLRLPATLSGSLSPYVGEAQLVETFFDEGPHGIRDKKKYEINITVPGSHELLLSFDQDAPEDVNISLLKDVQQKPSIYVHYPERVWDARVRTRSAEPKHPELDKDLERNIQIFLKTFDSTRGVARGAAKTEALDGLPDFEAVVPDNAFVVTNVLAKRELTRSLITRGTEDTDSSPPSWVVSEVWDLHVQPSSLARAGGSSVVVFAKDEKTMRSQGRLWWEASLLYEKAPQKEGELETLLNEVVEKLDWVGTPPVMVAKAKPDKGKKAKQEYVPYW
jgi:hypothetical protein